MTNITELEKYFVGFDKALDIWNSSNRGAVNDYPRFNIKKVSSGYEIQIALPGWSKEQITLTLHKNQLMIKGMRKSKEGESNWIHKGISEKSFERAFNLDADLEIVSANFKDGMLNVRLGYAASSMPQVIDIA